MTKENGVGDACEMPTTFRLDGPAKNIKCVLCEFVETNQLQTVVGNCGNREKEVGIYCLSNYQLQGVHGMTLFYTVSIIN